MTKGHPLKLIFNFALPMFIGNLFMQFYNIVDTLVVAKFIGNDAFAAVGSSFAIMVFINSVILGLSIGAAILISQLYGAKAMNDVKKVIVMSTVFVLVITLLMTLGTLLFIDQILVLYQMPEVTIGYAKAYLVPIFAGLFFVALYSITSNILRSLGDSKTPLYFLIVSCFINIGLDLLFVVPFQWGVFGAAFATVIAQFVSGVACFIYTIKKLRFLNFTRDDFKFDKPLFKKMSHYAFLSSIQQSVMNFGILMIQGLVNTFGTHLMAAFAAGVKIDAFAYMPAQELGNALSTYTAQNVGANDQQRVKDGLKAAMKITTIFSLAISLLVYLFANQLIELFLDEKVPEIIFLGSQYLRIEGLFYIFIGFLFIFYGYYRGIGRSEVSIVLTIISLGLRVLIAYGLVSVFGYIAIFYSIPIGWVIADIVGYIGHYFIKPKTVDVKTVELETDELY